MKGPAATSPDFTLGAEIARLAAERHTAGHASMRNSTSDPPVSFVQLIETLRPELLRFALWLARDRSVAEDIVQEALVRAWRAHGELRDTQAARSWLLTIVRREHARLYERKRLELTNLDEAIAREDADLARPGDDELVALRLAIFKLPAEYREPLVMQVLGGFSVAEIAQEMKLTNAAVLTRLFRARNKLRAVYGLAAVPDGDPDTP